MKWRFNLRLGYSYTCLPVDGFALLETRCKVVPTATSVWYQKIHLRIAILRDEDPACKLLKNGTDLRTVAKVIWVSKEFKNQKCVCWPNHHHQTSTSQFPAQLRTSVCKPMPLSTNVGGCTERHELRLLVCNTKRIKWRLLISPASISLKSRTGKQSLCICARYQRKDTHVSDPQIGRAHV